MAKNLKEEGQDNIVVGHVYKEKNAEQEVIPYFVDFNAALVNFAGVGRSNEDRARTSDFLNRFEYVGPVSAQRAEKQVSNEAALKDKEATRKADEKAAAEDRTAARRKTGV